MMLRMQDIALENQWVLIREDFNVPIKNNRVTNTARIDAALETIQYALSQKAKVILMSHLGRPKAGHFESQYSLQPIAEVLSQKLDQAVPLFSLGEKRPALKPGQLAMLENVRFLPGEVENDLSLAQHFAALGDVFVMDAFAVSHRAQASTCGVVGYAKQAVAGPLLLKELAAIEKIMANPQRPVAAIVGGSKVSTKLALLTNLLDKVDMLVLGGGIANTFLAAQNYPMGASLYEPDSIPDAKALMEKAKAQNKQIWLPSDVVVGHEISDEAPTTIKALTDVSGDDKIADIGPQSQKTLVTTLEQAQTILWNGPMGVFECAPFAEGTKVLAGCLAQSAAFTVAGGGDTLAAIAQFQVEEKLSYISTGGGAFLEALEGKTLPAVQALKEKALQKEEIS